MEAVVLYLSQNPVSDGLAFPVVVEVLEGEAQARTALAHHHLP